MAQYPRPPISTNLMAIFDSEFCMIQARISDNIESYRFHVGRLVYAYREFTGADLPVTVQYDDFRSFESLSDVVCEIARKYKQEHMIYVSWRKLQHN